jgi:Skp family chaperone for outer membrane proteins
MVVTWAALFPSIASAAKVGVVDLNKVTSDSAYFKGQLSALESFRQGKESSLDTQLKSLVPDMLFTSQEIENYRQLVVKGEPTADEQQQMKALEGVNSSRGQELFNLRKTRDAAPDQFGAEQQARLTELESLYTAALQRHSDAEKLSDDTQKEVDDQETTVKNKLWQELTDAIASVAQKQGLEVVLQKSLLLASGQASQEVLFCLYVAPQSDITDAVIKVVEQAHPSAKEGAPAPS